jgi:ubiquinol-cytochrome c reductase iron-sulfur subunit
MLAAGAASAAALATPPGRRSLIVDLRSIHVGEMQRFECNGVPLSVGHRAATQSKDEARKDSRSRDEWVVFQTLCTHLGCALEERAAADGGWICLCHGSEFDAAGRVTRGPAITDLIVPPHAFLDADTLSIDCG